MKEMQHIVTHALRLLYTLTQQWQVPQLHIGRTHYSSEAMTYPSETQTASAMAIDPLQYNSDKGDAIQVLVADGDILVPCASAVFVPEDGLKFRFHLRFRTTLTSAGMTVISTGG